MLVSFDELRCKEIINIRNGCKIGYPDDLEFDARTAKICKLVVYGRAKCFGLLGREEDYFVPWNEIEIIGEDTILVTCERPFHRRGKRRHGPAVTPDNEV